MPRILVLDDVAVDRALLCGLLASIPNADVVEFESADMALRYLEQSGSDLVVTDLEMPGMDGLDFTNAIRRIRRNLPVIVTTGQGDEDACEAALRAGAADFVPKSRLGQWLVPVATYLLELAHSDRANPNLLQHIVTAKFSFTLGNSLEMIPTVADFVRHMIGGLWDCDEAEQVRDAMILELAMTYAVLYSNLELDDDDFEGQSPWTIRAGNSIALGRLELDPYRRRNLYLNAEVSLTEARITLRSDGRRLLPADATQPATWCDQCGTLSRTLLMLNMLLDETSFQESENELVLVRHRDHVRSPIVI